MSNASVIDNFQRVKDRIGAAASSVDRNQDRIRLVVVTKGHPLEIVQEAIAAGAKHLGENYVEEALPKIASVENVGDLKWHMIGHVQSRKARRVCEHFDWVQTVDSHRLATRMDRFAGEMGKRVPILLECNVSGEETKFGWTAWNELEWEELAEEIEPILEMRNLEVSGLMTMAPFFPDAEEARPYFIRLRNLRDFLRAKYPQSSWDELSMGMSGDFELAIQCGSNMVRLGSIMFPQ